MPPPHPPSDHPTQIGPYALLECLRESASAWVFAVADENPLGPDLMLHSMKPGLVVGPSAAERFMRYAARLAVVQTPHLIVPIDSHFDELTGIVYFVTRRLAGPSLAERFRAGAMRPLTRAEIETTIGPVVDAVSRLQGQSCAHLEIGAHHVWLDGDMRAILGEARIDSTDPAATQRGHQPIRVASVSFPEERVTGIDELTRADVFGLGRLLFEAATGLPLESAMPILEANPSAEALESVERHIHQDLESHLDFSGLTALDDGLKTIIQRACQLSPYLRFDSAHHLLDAFEASKSGLSRIDTPPLDRSIPQTLTDPAAESGGISSASSSRASDNSHWRSSSSDSGQRRQSIDPQRIRRMGPYNIDRFIDAGGFAWVFEVSDPEVAGRRKLALKVLMPDAAEGDEFLRFERESNILVEHDHPNLVRVHRADRDLTTGCYYYSMTFVEGTTLSARLKEGPLTLAEVSRIFPGLLDALGAIHRRGVVHRDFKPKNIMGVQDRFPKLGDLGIAHQQDSSDQTSRGVAIGTSHYMSPEQAYASEQITPASDVFAAGVTLYEALTGQRIYQNIEGVDSSNAKAVESYLSEVARRDERIPIKYPAGVQVPRPLQKVIAKACRTKPEDRYADGDEMKKALDEALQGGTGRALPRWAFAVAAVVALAAVIVPQVYTRWISQSDANLARGAGATARALQEDARATRALVRALALPETERAVFDGADDAFLTGEDEIRLGERDLENGNWLSAQGAVDKSAAAYTEYCTLLAGGLLDQGGTVAAEAALDRIADLRRGFPDAAATLEAKVAPPRISATASPCLVAHRQADFLTRARTTLTETNQQIADLDLYPELARRAEKSAGDAQTEADRFRTTNWSGSKMASFYALEYKKSYASAVAFLEPASDWREDLEIEDSIQGFKEARVLFRRAAASATGHELAMRLPRLSDEEVDDFDPFAEVDGAAGEQEGTDAATALAAPDRNEKTPLQSLREARCDTAYFDTSNRAVGEIAAFCRKALTVAAPADGEFVPSFVEGAEGTGTSVPTTTTE